MFTFANYQLRPATEADRELCERWIEADPDHKGKVKADFFLNTEPGIECFVLEDPAGEVFFFRMVRALRVDIQFGPTIISRNRIALAHGMLWLQAKCQDASIRQVIFESTSVHLIEFCAKHFGFQTSPNELIRDIAAPKPGKS